MYRRSFLTLGGAAALAGCTTRIPDFRSHPELQIPERTGNIIESPVTYENNQTHETYESIEIMQTNRGKNHPDDIAFLESYFGGDDVRIVSGIKAFQTSNGLTADGDVGPSTLEAFYTRVFTSLPERLTSLQAKRLEVYREMIPYPAKTRWVSHLNREVTLHARRDPRVFSNSYYFGEVGGYPFGELPINQEIFNMGISENISRLDPVMIVRRLGGRYVMLGYNGGGLVFASYTSPGNEFHSDGHGEATPSGSWAANRGPQASDMHWITGAPSSVSNSNGRYYSDIMPYAVQVEGGVFGHAGPTNGLERSHGCLRLPLHYAKGLYELFHRVGEQLAWEIQV